MTHSHLNMGILETYSLPWLAGDWASLIPPEKALEKGLLATRELANSFVSSLGSLGPHSKVKYVFADSASEVFIYHHNGSKLGAASLTGAYFLTCVPVCCCGQLHVEGRGKL